MARTGSWSESEAREQCGKKYTQRVGKMSKQLRNYRSPQEIFDVHGADALRWYFFANQAPWNSIIYSERAIKESIPEFLLRLWNVYSFFVIYANIDGFDPSRLIAGSAGQLDGADARHGPALSAGGPTGRNRSVGAERTAPDHRDGGRADGRLRQLRGLHPASTRLWTR